MAVIKLHALVTRIGAAATARLVGGMQPNTISRIAEGRQVPRIDTVKRMQVLGIHFQDWFTLANGDDDLDLSGQPVVEALAEVPNSPVEAPSAPAGTEL